MVNQVDEGRRDRIIDAAMECIAEFGVAGTSHRVVAKRCGVPLGSMTYHFTGIDQLIYEAFHRFALQILALVETRLRNVTGAEEAIEAVVSLIYDDFGADQNIYPLTYELYAISARRAEFRPLVHEMIDAGYTALRDHFDDEAARAINTYIEGASTHHTLDTVPHTPEQVRRDLVKLAAFNDSV
ncbi:TetR family transcriptional regulator [Lysinibacter sp. HNR]|uniref:TetR/AcrR family transcriptional regulator n=1 Tax=Lysinibacter sp. HNR TaxID=3031408 RepID=UPI00243496EB|nr:TetR family transcriptional regulator [Lysinibacter sp. HNR]WGD36909.1 TetR family transcriptional regulator [Lysinibacter sp. HNR]